MGFAVVVGLFALGIVSIGLFPSKEFVLTDGWQNAFAWGTLIFFIATPIIGIITWLVRRLAKIKSNRRTMRLSFSALWLIGLFSFIALIVSVGRDFRSGNSINEQEITLSNPLVNKLEITSVSPDQKIYRNHWFRMEPFEGLDEDTVMVQNVSIHIIKSPTDSFRVTILKMVNGRTRRYADTLAALINYSAIQKDSLLIIDRGIAINRQDKFRNQRVVVTIYVPVGKQIRVDRNVGWGDHFHFGPWGDDDWNIDFEDTEWGWNEDMDYVMKADGLYELNGNPADQGKHPKKKQDQDDDQDGDNVKQKPDSDRASGYRYNDKNAVPQHTDSLSKQKSQKELQQHQQDSLPKEKNKTDKLQSKTGDKVLAERFNETIAYTLPAYNPMLIMN